MRSYFYSFRSVREPLYLLLGLELEPILLSTLRSNFALSSKSLSGLELRLFFDSAPSFLFDYAPFKPLVIGLRLNGLDLR